MNEHTVIKKKTQSRKSRMAGRRVLERYHPKENGAKFKEGISQEG